MAETMRAIVKTAPGRGAQLQEVPKPVPGDGEALVRVVSASICGTDHHIFEWNEWAQGRIGPHIPQIMGHELCGVVEEVGPGVSGVSEGDFVSAETHIVCRNCIPCSRGQYNVCLNTRILGVDIDGAFADYIVVPAGNLWNNPPDLDPRVASALEPLGNAVHTATIEPLAGRQVLVTGAGPIGVFAVGVARITGASTIIVSEPNAYRLDLAGRMGADHMIDPSEIPLKEAVRDITGNGVDAVLEMSGHPQAIRDAISCTIPGGHVAQLGLPPGDVSMDLNELIFRGIRFYGIVGRKIWETWVTMSKLLSEEGLDITPVLTHTLDLELFQDGIDLMDEGTCGKVVLSVSQR